MKKGLIKVIAASLLFHRKEAVYQLAIVIILASVITGSLLTGYSVRSSLKRTAAEKLGNTGFLISSGLRYFDASLTERISDNIGETVVPLLETDGYCTNFGNGLTLLNTKIYGIEDDFFHFHGIDNIAIEKGTIAINEKTAQQLGADVGDEVILNFHETDPLPGNAPFAPSKENKGQKVMQISKILTPQQAGNFSLGASQMIPLNIFVNISDIAAPDGQGSVKANRILIRNRGQSGDSAFYRILHQVLIPADIGLKTRVSDKTGEAEIISERIFIDSTLVDEIKRAVPSALPVITYLVNSFTLGDRSTPYSFVSSLPDDLIGNITDDQIVINRWLADDLGAAISDTLKLTWYDPAPGSLLKEKSGNFIIKRIEENSFRFADPLLMPDFPGITGSTTCSGWDAGVPILMDRIRDKDEAYWNEFRGTPKAFINYIKGRELWGNNFGPATSLRFPVDVDSSAVISGLSGNIDPLKAGFTLSDIRKANMQAASEGVDFSTLFLSLSFFIIMACIVLLAMAVSLYFDSRKRQIRTYFVIGFRNSIITKLIFSETFLISAIGALAGALAGYLINVIIIRALNGVWQGAVNTNTLSPAFSVIPLLTGFLVTVLIMAILIRYKLRSFLRNLQESSRNIYQPGSSRRNLAWLMFFFISALCLIGFSLFNDRNTTLISFTGGSLLLIAMILLLRQYYLKAPAHKDLQKTYHKRYFSFHPSHAVTPALFIAAGIFAMVITGANRQGLTGSMLLPSGGTGAYLLWAESALPVGENLNTPEGFKEFGFDEAEFSEMEVVQALKLHGDDASCLNINHVKAPPVLGLNPSSFIERGSFSFASAIKRDSDEGPWSLLNEIAGDNTIYGIADQTVLQWGLKIRTGDTLKYRAENGEALNIIIGAGLKSSLFQGHLIIGENNFRRFFPSVPGSSVFLIDGKKELSDIYREAIAGRMSGYGMSVESAGDKLASFFVVTNAYLGVFMLLGVFGLLLGAAGFGYILLRNLNSRKREFAVMLATGYSSGTIKRILLNDHLLILGWGVLSGSVSAAVSTWPSLRQGSEMPWMLLVLMISSILIIGYAVLIISIRQITDQSLVTQLRRE